MTNITGRNLSDRDLIEQLHFACVALTIAKVGDPERMAEVAVNYLHEVLAEMKLGPKQRDLVDRMAAKIAAKGLDIGYGAYF